MAIEITKEWKRWTGGRRLLVTAHVNGLIHGQVAVDSPTGTGYDEPPAEPARSEIEKAAENIVRRIAEAVQLPVSAFG